VTFGSLWSRHDPAKSLAGFCRATLLACSTVGAPVAFAQVVAISGSTIPVPVYSAWGSVYEKQTGLRVVYDAAGSSASLERVAKGSAYIAVSNRPMPEDEVEAKKLIQFPMLSGAVVPVVNIVGVESGQIKLTGNVLADIYLGKINRWTDQAIVSLNPRVRLPAGPITVVHRRDGSSTTFLLTSYFKGVSADWKERVGSGSTVKFPVGVGVDGVGAMLDAVKQLPNSIGYFHYSVVRKLQLKHLTLQNKAGNFVSPGYREIQAATQAYDWSGAMSNFTIDSSHQDAWPISSPSFVIMRTNFRSAKDAANGLRALDFLSWALQNGDQNADDQQFIPLPSDVKAEVRREVGVRLTLLTANR